MWVLPHFRHAQGSPGFGVVVYPRGQHPGWVSGVTWQQGRGAEVSSHILGRAAGAWRAAGAAQDVPESLVGCGCRGIYGQKVRSISCAEAKGWGCVSQVVGAASQDLGCTLGVFSEMTGQLWIPHFAKNSRLWGLQR